MADLAKTSETCEPPPSWKAPRGEAWDEKGGRVRPPLRAAAAAPLLSVAPPLPRLRSRLR